MKIFNTDYDVDEVRRIYLEINGIVGSFVVRLAIVELTKGKTHGSFVQITPIRITNNTENNIIIKNELFVWKLEIANGEPDKTKLQNIKTDIQKPISFEVKSKEYVNIYDAVITL